VVFGLTRDDQRRARLVDQDRVDLVDDGEAELALHPLAAGRVDHVVAQVVETEFVVRAVGDVGGVGGLLVLVLHLRQVDADGEAEKTMQSPHPLGVAIGQVVVDRDHVDAVAGKRIQVGGQRCHQRLALTGPHLGDLAIVQDHAADQLNIEVTHAERALAGLANDGKSLRQQRIQRFALGHPGLEFSGLAAQRLVGQRADPRLQGVDLAHHLRVLLDQPIIAAAENLLE
jgi:hypothetical protein